MVAMTDPRLGETVLDPAAGTGGFLVESFNHLAAQVKTVSDRKTLQEKSLFGCEPKPLPYLLCQMNLLLHGLDSPRIERINLRGIEPVQQKVHLAKQIRQRLGFAAEQGFLLQHAAVRHGFDLLGKVT